MKFDKKIFLDNIDFFLNEKGIKPKDLEEASGVSKGYISRLKKEGNQSIPGIDFLLTASEMFGITVEALATINFSMCTENEKYYMNLFERLICKTNCKEIYWKNYSFKDFLNKIEKKMDEELIIEQEHSFFDSLTNAVNGRRNYNSTFEYGPYEFDEIEGDFFALKFEQGNILYMVKVKLAYQEECFTGLEMFMITNHTKKNNVCCISPQNPQKYDRLFYKLYDTVKESVNANMMDSETKRIIDDFLNS